MKPATTNHEKIFFPNLDGFRTIAFLIVFLGHCFLLFDFGERTTVIRILNKMFGKPGAGVHFFFVLSGFLISYLLLTEKKKFGKINIRAFYMRRILRIWPVYFTVVGIACLLSYSISAPFYSLHDASFGMIFTFLTNFNLAYSGISSLPLTVLWSVAVEEQFYLVLPLLLVLFSKRIFYLFPVFIACSLAFGLIHLSNIELAEFHTVSVCSSLFIGCICAFLTIYHDFSKLFADLKKGIILAAYIGFFMLHLYREKLFPPDKNNVALYFVYALFFAFFIMEQNYSKNSFYKMKNFRFLSVTGKYTYGLYAYHIIFISILMLFIPGSFNPAGNYVLYFSLWISTFLAVYLFARGSYHFIEKPFLKLKEKFSHL